MAKRRIRIEVETDLHKAIEQEAAKQGTSNAAIVRSCAQKFLSKVNDTLKRSKLKPKNKNQREK